MRSVGSASPPSHRRVGASSEYRIEIRIRIRNAVSGQRFANRNARRSSEPSFPVPRCYFCFTFAKPQLPAARTSLLVVLRRRAEQGAAQRLALDVLVLALALALLLLLDGLFGFGHRHAGDALHALHLPVVLALLRRARVGGSAVGLGATAKAEEVVIKALIVRVDLGAALVADAFVPGPTGVNAVVLAAPA